MSRFVVLCCILLILAGTLPAWAPPMGQKGPGGSTAETAAAAHPASHMALVLPIVLVAIAVIAVVVALAMKKKKG